MKFDPRLKNFREHLRAKRVRPLTLKNYLISVSQFLSIIGKQPQNITKQDLEQYEGYCTRYKPNSLTQKYSAINKYLLYLINKGVLPEEIEKWKLKAPSKEETIKHPLTEEQRERVFKVAERNPLHRAIFLTFFYGMLRRSEIIALTIDDVNFRDKTLDIRDAKGGCNSTIHISDRCLEAIRYYLDNCRETPKPEFKKTLFLNSEGKKLSESYLQVLHKEYKVRCNFPKNFKFFTHIWRITGITEFAKHEKDIKILMAQSRHKSPDVLMSYIQKSSNEIKDSYTKAFETDGTKVPMDKPRLPDDTDQYIASLEQRIKELENNLKDKEHLSMYG